MAMTAEPAVARPADTAAAQATEATEAQRRTVRRWLRVFAAHVPATRPLAVLDLGSGAGRFTPALADEFGGPVWGVEPSQRRREEAVTQAPHPRVSYLDGRAERIPLPDGACDVALMFLSLHHTARQEAVFAEIARVCASGATVLVRCVFGDRIPDVYWHRFFPSIRGVLARDHRTLAQVLADAGAAGLRPVTLEAVAVEEPTGLRELYERARRAMTGRPGPIPAAEVTTGLDAMAHEAAARGDEMVPAPPADLLVLRRGPRRPPGRTDEHPVEPR